MGAGRLLPSTSSQSTRRKSLKISRLTTDCQYSSCSSDLLVVLHILRARLAVSEPLLTLAGQQLLHEVLDDEVDVGGPPHLAQQDVLVEAELVPGEGRPAGEELVGEDAEGPPVHALLVAGLQDDLGRHVVRGPALGPAPLSRAHRPGEPQVGYHGVAGLVQQDVLWLQVSVDDVERVEVGDGSDDLRDVEQSRIQVELAVAPEIREEFATTDLRSVDNEDMLTNISIA